MNHPKLTAITFCLLFSLFSLCCCGKSSKETSEQDPKQNQNAEQNSEKGTEESAEENKELPEDAIQIVLDPGHGGFDPGKVNADGTVEKDINLQISLKLKQELENNGIAVTMTREKDMGLYEETSKAKKSEDLKNRCKLIEEKAPVCTVSIHQNSFTDPAVYGPQVFYYHTSEGSKELASALQAALNEDLAIAKPRVEKENESYYMLKRSPSTTVIVECGFLSNENEAKLLITEEYQTKVAQSICRGLLTWLNGNCYNEVYENENI